MTAILFSLATAVPGSALAQSEFSRVASRHLSLTEAQSRLLERVTSSSRINNRHTVVEDFPDHGLQGAPFGHCQGAPQSGARNQVFKKQAPPLAESVCNEALQQWGGECQAITHLISVSCTGMMAPGIEFLLIEKLGLSPCVERLGINFMGCFGAIKGLAVAKALALENPAHRILLVCTELCSLHFHADDNNDTLIANSLFADGAAAAVVGSRAHAEEKPLFEICKQASFAIPGTEELMSWEGGDHGYRMRLSPAVPAQIEAHIPSFVSRLTGGGHPLPSYGWAVHPGGKSILEAVERACSLDSGQLRASWKVLESYGNMSSPTFLFVLKELLEGPLDAKEIIGLSFGPGLAVEGMLLTYVAE